jgi:CheY-like chemotaxis protein
MTTTDIRNPTPHERRQGQPSIVLVVEDDPILRYMLASELRYAEFSVWEASNADEAEHLLVGADVVDVVITDIEMPGPRNGLALAAFVRAFRPSTKVIVASGVPNPRTNELADAYFSKPYDIDLVIERVESLLEES